MPRSLPRRALSCFRAAEVLVIGEFQRLVERGAIIARVVGHDDRRLVGELRDVVPPAEFGWILTEFAGGSFDEPLDHESRLGPSGAAIGVDRGRIRVDRIDLAVDRRNVVLARQERGIEIGRHRRGEGRQIGAEIGDGVNPKSQDLAALVGRHLRMGNVIAAMRVG